MEVSDDATDAAATETGGTVDTASDTDTPADTADGTTVEPTEDTPADDSEDTPADDSSDSSDSNWSPTTCPSCGNGVLMEVVMGPSEAHLSPCGCRVAPGFLQRQRD